MHISQTVPQPRASPIQLNKALRHIEMVGFLAEGDVREI